MTTLTEMVEKQTDTPQVIADKLLYYIQDKIENKCEGLIEVECPVTHEFADGLYVRRMVAPAGSLVIGEIHRFATYNILLRGSAILLVGEGKKPVTINAPYTFVSKPGERKVAFFPVKSEWLNFHPTKETNVDKIRKIFIIPTTKCIEGEKIWVG